MILSLTRMLTECIAYVSGLTKAVEFIYPKTGPGLNSLYVLWYPNSLEKNLGHRKRKWPSREDPRWVRTSQHSGPGRRLCTCTLLHCADCLFVSRAKATPAAPKHTDTQACNMPSAPELCPKAQGATQAGKGPRFTTCLCKSWVGCLGGSRVQRLELGPCHLSEPAYL